MQTSILVPTFNQQKYLKQCVENIQKNTDAPYEIIFINNGITKGGSKWLRSIINEIPNCRLIDTPEHFSYADRVNQGLHAACGGYIVLLHNDVTVTAGWLCGIIDFLDAHSDVGLVGPMTTNVDGVQAIGNPKFLSEDQVDSFAGAFKKRYRHRCVSAPKLSGICVGLKRQHIEQIGGFDAQFQSHDVMIEDVCLRSGLAGFNNAVVADVFVYHANHHKPHKNKSHSIHPVAEDRKAYNQKWNYLDPHTALGQKLLVLKAIEKGIAVSQAGQMNKALEIFSEGLTCAPQNPDLALTMAEVRADAGNYQQALEILSGNILSEKQTIRNLELTGYCKQGLEQFEAAERSADRLLEIKPESAPALNLKGLIASRCGDKKSAANFFLKVLEADPGYGQAYTNLGTLKQESGQIQEALELFEKGFVLSAADRNSAANYHSSITTLNAFDRAEDMFREAVALYPRHKQLAYYLIDVLLKLKKYKPAMEVIRQAIVSFGMQDGILDAALAIKNKVGPKAIGPSAKQRATVSLCMIAKNEQAHLAKCLWSADAIVDEIIVVDTGSTDRTKDIAAVFGARVYEFKWINDFSAARNVSLAKASGDWIFVLDADEVLSASDCADFRQMISRSHSNTVAYEFVTRNYTTKVNIIGWKPNDGLYAKEEAASGWTSSEKVRLFPNSTAIRFEYPVHELVEPSLKQKGLTVKHCDIPIHHYGKLSQKKAAAKIEPYYRLGKKKLADLEGNAVAIRELAVQAAILGNHHEAVGLWKRFIALLPNIADGYINIGASYTQLGQYEAALSASQKAFELDPQREEARYNYGISQLYLGNAEKAIDALEQILERFPDYLPADFMLSAAYSCNDNKEKGMQGFKRLRKTAIGQELSFRCFDLARSLMLYQLMDYVILLLEAAIDSGVVSKDARSLLSNCIQLKEAAGETKKIVGIDV